MAEGFTPCTLAPFERNMRNVIQPLQRHDALRIRAAHRIPSFTVAVEGVYQFLRSLVLGEPTRSIRVVALPGASSFTVELAAEYDHSRQHTAIGFFRLGVEESWWLSDLTAISKDVRLCVALKCSAPHVDLQASSLVGHLGVILKSRWSYSDPLLEEDFASCVHAALVTGLQTKACRMNEDFIQKKKPMKDILIVHLSCNVSGLFCCMPVRRCSETRLAHSSYRLRAGRRALVTVVYHMAVECILAPLYLLPNKETRYSTSLYLRIGNDDGTSHHNQKRAAVDIDDVFYLQAIAVTNGVEVAEPLAKRSRTEPRVNPSSSGLHNAYRVLSTFFPHLRPSGGVSGFSSGNISMHLREVVVEHGRFAVLFLVRSTLPPEGNGCFGRRSCPVPSAVVVSMHVSSSACYVVDELHRVHHHVALLFPMLCPLIVFVAEDLLEGTDATLQQMFQATSRQYHMGVETRTRDPQNAEEESNAPLVVDKLTGTRGEARNSIATTSTAMTAATGLRVSFLAGCITSAIKRKGQKRGEDVVIPHPRRTPFCPPQWSEGVCRASTLTQIRSVMHVKLDPSHIVTRLYKAPAVWPGPRELDPHLHGCSPFRAEHFIGQWDQKFLLFNLNDAGGEQCSSSSGEIQSNCLGSSNASAPVVVPTPSPRPTLHFADQHAIHERLRLEYFLVTAESYVQRHSVRVSFPVKIPPDICHDVTNNESVLVRWGWRFERGGTQWSGIECGAMTSDDCSCLSHQCVSVVQWPFLVIEGHVLVLDTIETLRATVEELAVVLPPSQTVTEGCQGLHVVPSAILQFLITRSCRGALMFGDRLSAAHTMQLIDALQAVVQYTVCSHGRPAFAVLHSRF